MSENVVELIENEVSAATHYDMSINCFFFQYEFGSEYGSQENLAAGETAKPGQLKPGAKPTALQPSEWLRFYHTHMSG